MLSAKGRNLPPVHRLHAERPGWSAKRPVVQFTQKFCDALNLIVLIPQSVHTVAPVELANLPRGHALQTVRPVWSA